MENMEETLIHALACRERLAAEQQQELHFMTVEGRDEESVSKEGAVAMQTFMVTKQGGNGHAAAYIQIFLMAGFGMMSSMTLDNINVYTGTVCIIYCI